jgi:hypothetical protein
MKAIQKCSSETSLLKNGSNTINVIAMFVGYQITSSTNVHRIQGTNFMFQIVSMIQKTIKRKELATTHVPCDNKCNQTQAPEYKSLRQRAVERPEKKKDMESS